MEHKYPELDRGYPHRYMSPEAELEIELGVEED
jgi:hypothetical protein